MNKDLILLFYPKTEPQNLYFNLPLSLIKIASQLKAGGFKPMIIDSRVEPGAMERVAELLPRAICLGVSCMTGYQIHEAIKVTQLAKRVDPDFPVIWGGWHPSLLPEETIRNKDIDIIVKGQGEKALGEIAEQLKNGGDLSGISGIVYRDKSGKTVFNPDRPFADINGFSPIDFSLFDNIDIGKYIHRTPLGERTIFWNTSQGCLYDCGFCCTSAMHGRRWSGLKTESIIREIRILSSRFRIDSIVFCEDNFFTDRERIRRLSENLIAEKIKIKWAADCRIDQLLGFSDDLLSLFKKSGCDKIYLGAESGDQQVLDLIDKKIKVGDIYRAAEILDRHDIVGELFVMVGFFLDPKKDLEQTIALISRIKKNYPDHQATPTLYTPYPGTKLFEASRQKGFSSPRELDQWINWSILCANVPWINKAYRNRLNMLIKFYLPFAYPSKSLQKVMRKGKLGILYKLTHKLARFRISRNLLVFPIEWHLVNYFYYKIKPKRDIFKDLVSPR